MVQITVETNFGQIKAALTRAERKLSNPTELVTELCQFAVERLDESYLAQTDPYGAAWAPLAPSTLRQKSGSSILIDSGSLNASLGYKANGDTGIVGYQSKIVKYHQFGTSKMPARPVVPDSGIPGAWQPQLQSLLEDYLREALW